MVDRAADLGDDGMQLGERADETGELRHRTAGPAQRRLCEVRRPLGRCNVEQLLRIKRSAECGLLQHGADVHGIAETDIRAARLNRIASARRRCRSRASSRLPVGRSQREVTAAGKAVRCERRLRILSNSRTRRACSSTDGL